MLGVLAVYEKERSTDYSDEPKIITMIQYARDIFIQKRRGAA
jgi:hypothetical protein